MRKLLLFLLLLVAVPAWAGPTTFNHKTYRGGQLHEACTDGVCDAIVIWKNGTSQAMHNGRLGLWTRRLPNEGPPVVMEEGGPAFDGPQRHGGHQSLGATTPTAAYMAAAMTGAAMRRVSEPTVIDDYVFITQAQINKWGGMTSATNQVHLAADAMNESFQHAGIYAEQRVVGIALYDGPAEDTTGQDWNNYYNAFAVRVGQNQFATQRANTGFDTITLYRVGGLAVGVCGTAYISNPTFPLHVVDGDCATSNLSYAHECGHTLGLTHNWGDSGYDARCGPTAVGYGESRFRTPMSYNGGPRTRQYSAPPPAVWYSDNSSAVGIAGQTDATRCIKITMDGVAAYHARVIPYLPPAHTAPVVQSWFPNQTVTHTAPTQGAWSATPPTAHTAPTITGWTTP